MTRQDWSIAALVFLLAMGVRASALDAPPTRLFDEVWYARDGCFRWLDSKTTCAFEDFTAPDRDVQANLAKYGEVTPEHPPLGKLLIGVPIKLFGFGPRAWRLAALLAGSLTVVLLLVLVRLAFGSTWLAAGSSLLLAVDYPLFIHSRLAMLDVFLCLFTLAAFLFCFLDREQIAARMRGAPSHQRWRFAAGMAAGAAAASKPSGGAVAVGVLVLVVGWEVVERRRTARVFEVGARVAGSIALLLIIVPLVVYAASYAGLIQGSLLALPWADGSWVREWVERQSYMLSLHSDKPSTLSSPWALPMTTAPQAYLLERRGDVVRQVLLFGNPVLWWAGFAAVLYTAYRWLRDRSSAIAPVIVVGFLAAYASWLSATLTKTVAFLFYVVPVAPFVYLALAYVYSELPPSRGFRAAAIGAVCVSAAAFAFYLPILSARPQSVDSWKPRACSAQALWLDVQPECGLGRAQRP